MPGDTGWQPGGTGGSPGGNELVLLIWSRYSVSDTEFNWCEDLQGLVSAQSRGDNVWWMAEGFLDHCQYIRRGFCRLHLLSKLQIIQAKYIYSIYMWGRIIDHCQYILIIVNTLEGVSVNCMYRPLQPQVNLSIQRRTFHLKICLIMVISRIGLNQNGFYVWEPIFSY